MSSAIPSPMSFSQTLSQGPFIRRLVVTNLGGALLDSEMPSGDDCLDECETVADLIRWLCDKVVDEPKENISLHPPEFVAKLLPNVLLASLADEDLVVVVQMVTWGSSDTGTPPLLAPEGIQCTKRTSSAMRLSGPGTQESCLGTYRGHYVVVCAGMDHGSMLVMTNVDGDPLVTPEYFHASDGEEPVGVVSDLPREIQRGAITFVASSSQCVFVKRGKSLLRLECSGEQQWNFFVMPWRPPGPSNVFQSARLPLDDEKHISMFSSLAVDKAIVWNTSTESVTSLELVGEIWEVGNKYPSGTPQWRQPAGNGCMSTIWSPFDCSVIARLDFVFALLPDFKSFLKITLAHDLNVELTSTTAQPYSTISEDGLFAFLVSYTHELSVSVKHYQVSRTGNVSSTVFYTLGPSSSARVNARLAPRLSQHYRLLFVGDVMAAGGRYHGFHPAVFETAGSQGEVYSTDAQGSYVELRGGCKAVGQCFQDAGMGLRIGCTGQWQEFGIFFGLKLVRGRQVVLNNEGEMQSRWVDLLM